MDLDIRKIYILPKQLCQYADLLDLQCRISQCDARILLSANNVVLVDYVCRYM